MSKVERCGVIMASSVTLRETVSRLISWGELKIQTKFQAQFSSSIFNFQASSFPFLEMTILFTLFRYRYGRSSTQSWYVSLSSLCFWILQLWGWSQGFLQHIRVVKRHERGRLHLQCENVGLITKWILIFDDFFSWVLFMQVLYSLVLNAILRPYEIHAYTFSQNIGLN